MKKCVVFSFALSIAFMTVLTEANFFGDYDSVGSSGSHHQTIPFIGDHNSNQQRSHYDAFDGDDDDSFQNVRVGGFGHGSSGRKRGSSHSKSESSKKNERESSKKNDDDSSNKNERKIYEPYEHKVITHNRLISRAERKKMKEDKLRKLQEKKDLEGIDKEIDKLLTSRNHEVEKIRELNVEMRSIFAQKLWNDRKLKREQKQKQKPQENEIKDWD